MCCQLISLLLKLFAWYSLDAWTVFSSFLNSNNLAMNGMLLNIPYHIYFIWYLWLIWYRVLILLPSSFHLTFLLLSLLLLSLILLSYTSTHTNFRIITNFISRPCSYIVTWKIISFLFISYLIQVYQLFLFLTIFFSSHVSSFWYYLEFECEFTAYFALKRSVKT